MGKARVALLLMLTLPGVVAAQEFADWQQQQNDAWEENRRLQQREFQSYLDRQWQAFERFRAHIRDVVPKPVQVPRVRDAGTAPSATFVPPALPNLSSILLPPALPGWLVPPVALHPRPDNAVRRFHQRATASQPAGLVEKLQEHARSLSDSDWMIWQVMQAAGRHYYPDDPSRQTLIAWLLMNQAGYAVRIGYDDQGLVLLLPIREKVYGRPWYRIGDVTYYRLSDGGSGNLYSYPQAPLSRRPLTVAIKQHPALPQGTLLRNWSSAAPAPMSINANLASYYADYPQLDLVYYFAAPLSAGLRQQLRDYWQLHGSGDTVQEQLTVLLQWLQHMPYATDQEQFGEENYLLPDEILFHAASDCEDRSMLYVHWVRAIFGDQGLEVAGLDYPGHVAVGLGIAGPGLRWEGAGSSWLVADPTYVGAGLGLTVPQVDGVAPTVIPVPKVPSRF